MHKSDIWLDIIATRAGYIAEKYAKDSPTLFNIRNAILRAYGIDPETGDFAADISPFLQTDITTQAYILAGYIASQHEVEYTQALDLAKQAISYADERFQQLPLITPVDIPTLSADIPEMTIYTDGASRGNPGPASYAYVIYDQDKNIIHEHASYMGHMTNNVAEYTALFEGLKHICKDGKISAKVHICTDSELMTKQILWIYKVKDEKIRPIYNGIVKLLLQLKYDIKHIPRAQNTYADALCNKCLDNQTLCR